MVCRDARRGSIPADPGNPAGLHDLGFFENNESNFTLSNYKKEVAY